MKTCRKCAALFDARKCKACARISAAQYREKNRTRVLAATKKWQEAHPEAMRAAVAGYRGKNPEQVKARITKWRKKNPKSGCLYAQNRRAKKRENGGVLSRGLVEKLFELQRGKCPCCHKPLGCDYHLDHKMPLALGGKNEDWNMQLLRKKCNTKKQAKHPIQFMRDQGFLL